MCLIVNCCCQLFPMFHPYYYHQVVRGFLLNTNSLHRCHLLHDTYRFLQQPHTLFRSSSYQLQKIHRYTLSSKFSIPSIFEFCFMLTLAFFVPMHIKNVFFLRFNYSSFFEQCQRFHRLIFRPAFSSIPCTPIVRNIVGFKLALHINTKIGSIINVGVTK